ncbi:MAG: hypothetical protein EB119_06540 [Synechococcaceae bacterium WBB_34_004]|nr:hypothetical protein [Synechococcaceae bacterium WBB_34_004]
MNYRTTVISGQSGGGFRQANAGVSLGKPTYEQRLVECFLYEHDVELDAAAQAASLGDSVADFQHGANIAHRNRFVVVLNLLFEDGADLVGTDGNHGRKAVLGEERERVIENQAARARDRPRRFT